MVKAYFLQIIKDYIHNQETEHQAVDIKELCLYANQQQLSSIIYYQIKLAQLAETYYQGIAIAIKRKQLNSIVINSFQDNNIMCFVVKGPYIAEYYPHPFLRTMGDTDIVVDNIDKADSVMCSIGFVCGHKSKDGEYHYVMNGLKYEIHSMLEHKRATNDDRIDDFINDFWGYVVDGKLDHSFHFIFLIVHLRKHMMNQGIGFRQFLDIAITAKNCDDLDWAWIENKLEEVGLLNYAQVVFAFLKRWWDIETPIGSREISNDFFNSATDFIFSNGVFGFENKDNKHYQEANEIRKKTGGRLKRCASLLFPSYRDLCNEGKISFINDKPFLLPVAWVYRIVNSILNGNIKAKFQYATSSNVSSEYIRKREEMFHQWGLS